jgi:hypothetical protein
VLAGARKANGKVFSKVLILPFILNGEPIKMQTALALPDG